MYYVNGKLSCEQIGNIPVIKTGNASFPAAPAGSQQIDVSFGVTLPSIPTVMVSWAENTEVSGCVEGLSLGLVTKTGFRAYCNRKQDQYSWGFNYIAVANK